MQQFSPVDAVSAVAVGEVDGTPVAVTGGNDGAVRVWDLRAVAARGELLRGHTGAVRAVAVGEVDGTPVAVTGDDNGTISMRALDRNQRVSARLVAPAGITAIAFSGQAGWLTSTEDGGLFVWRPTQAPTRVPGDFSNIPGFTERKGTQAREDTFPC